MKEKILNTINKYNLIKSGDKIVIGVSGGPDSICLLHVLNILKDKLNFNICVAHINHMIREEADMETEYVKKFCEQINVECYIKKIDVIKIAEQRKMGTEETGRNIRYAFFEEILQKTGSNKIATAHNSNDKVETVLMNILRGSGISGLKGIEAIRDNRFIRPLIEIERSEIEKYCDANKLTPKIDKSNLENIYTRNKVRNIVIPYIKQEFNPNIIKTVNRLSDVATLEDEYLKEITEKEYERLLSNEGNEPIALKLREFNKLNLVIKQRLILYTINKVIGTVDGIEKINIDDIIKLCNNNIGNKFLIPNKNIKILVKNKKIFFIPNHNVP